MKLPNMLKLASALISVSVLSGCSVFAPVSIKNPTEYSLSQVPAVRVARHHGSRILMVMTPDADPYYRTTQMAYELKPHQVSYYTMNAWAELPAQMLQPLLVKTLQKTNHYRAVVAPPVTGKYDYMLNTQIITLRANLDWCHPVYEVTLRVQMFSAASNRVIATKDITVHEPIMRGTFYNNVLASNRAMARALSQVAQFALRATH